MNIFFSAELPAGEVVEFLVGFQNRGQQDFVLETLEASFRYPMDFSFYIQNFTTYGFNRIVKPNEESSLSYSFLTPETFAGRPVGLNVHLNYRDAVNSCFISLDKKSTPDPTNSRSELTLNPRPPQLNGIGKHSFPPQLSITAFFLVFIFHSNCPRAEK